MSLEGSRQQESCYELFQQANRKGEMSVLEQQDLTKKISRIIGKSRRGIVVALNNPLKCTLPISGGRATQIDWSPFMMACARGWEDVVSYLLKERSTFEFDLNEQDAQGYTPLDRLAIHLESNKIDPNTNPTFISMRRDGAKLSQRLDLLEPSAPPLDFEPDLDVQLAAATPSHQVKIEHETRASEYIRRVKQNELSFKDAASIIGSFYEEGYDFVPQPVRKYAAWQGGGAKGANYVGTMQAFQDTGILDDFTHTAGASAGAITSFMVAMGLDARQFQTISDRLNFLDLTQTSREGYRDTLGAGLGKFADLATKGAMFTGQSFHHWASMMVEQILGDPNASFADLHEACKVNPALKELICKGTQYDDVKGVLETTFSYETTPNVRIADAVRASMAFPTAFAPFHVKYKDGNLFSPKPFTDGGMMNNYPIDVFGEKEYEDAHYPSMTKTDDLNKRHQVNPAVVGMSLCSARKLDPEITPQTPAIRRMLSEMPAAKGRKRSGSSSSGSPGPSRAPSPVGGFSDESSTGMGAVSAESWRWSHLMWGGWYNKFGRAQNEDVSEKYRVYDRQTIQTFNQDIDTLEFDVSEAKLQRAIKGTYDTTKLWLETFCDPTQPYCKKPALDKSVGSGTELFLQDTPSDDRLYRRNKESYFTQKITNCFMQINLEMARMQQWPDMTDDRLSQNVRLKYLSTYLQELISDSDFPNIKVEACFKAANRQYLERIQSIQAHRERIEWLLDDSAIVQRINAELATNTPESKHKARSIISGQISRIIPQLQLRDRTGSMLLANLINTNDAVLVDEVLERVEYNIQQVRDQGRVQDAPHLLSEILNHRCVPNVFEISLKTDNPELIAVLIKHGVDVISYDPKLNSSGILYAVKQGQFNAFMVMADAALKSGVDLKSETFIADMGGAKFSGTLLHYIVEHAPPEFAEQLMGLSADNPVFQMLQQSCKSMAANAQGLSAAERAADLVDKHAMARLEAERNVDDDWVVMPEETEIIGGTWQMINKLVPQDDIRLAKRNATQKLEEKRRRTEQAELARKQIMRAPQDTANIIKACDAQALLDILTLADGESEFYLQLAASNQEASNDVLKTLLDRLYALDKYKATTLINQKFIGKSLLYVAAENGNEDIVRHLRNVYDAEVNNSGPNKRSCAITQAANKGHLGVLQAIVETYRGSWGRATQIDRHKADHKGQTALHYLAQNPASTPEAFITLVFGTVEAPRNPEKVMQAKDSQNRTALSYLIEHDRGDIVKVIINTMQEKGYALDDVMGWRLTGKLDVDKEVCIELLEAVNKGGAYKGDMIRGLSSKTQSHFHAFLDLVQGEEAQNFIAINQQIIEGNFIIAQQMMDLYLKTPEICLRFMETEFGGERNIYRLAKVPEVATQYIRAMNEAESANAAKMKLFRNNESGALDRTLLYVAANHGNSEVVRHLRTKHDAAIEGTGPDACPSAFCAAAKAGHHDTVIAFMQTYKGTGMQLSSWLSAGMVEAWAELKRGTPDETGKTALHYLAEQKGDRAPIAFMAVFSGGGKTSKPESIVNCLDSNGQTPLSILLQSENEAVIKGIISRNYKLYDLVQGEAQKQVFVQALHQLGQSNPGLFNIVLSNLSARPDVAEEVRQKLGALELERSSHQQESVAVLEQEGLKRTAPLTLSRSTEGLPAASSGSQAPTTSKPDDDKATKQEEIRKGPFNKGV